MCSFRDSLLGYRFYVPVRERDKLSFLVQETKKTKTKPNLELAECKGINCWTSSVQPPIKISLVFKIKD